MCLISVMSDSSIPWTVAHQASLSIGFPRQEYWSGLPCPSLGVLPNPGIKPRGPTLQADSLPSEPPEKPFIKLMLEIELLITETYSQKKSILSKCIVSLAKQPGKNQAAPPINLFSEIPG